MSLSGPGIKRLRLAKGATLAAVGAQMGMTRERVRQLECSAYLPESRAERLREAIEAAPPRFHFPPKPPKPPQPVRVDGRPLRALCREAKVSYLAVGRYLGVWFTTVEYWWNGEHRMLESQYQAVLALLEDVTEERIAAGTSQYAHLINVSTCATCGNIEKTERGTRQYCSRECSPSRLQPERSYTCGYCGNVGTTRRSLQRYCSAECRYLASEVRRHARERAQAEIK